MKKLSLFIVVFFCLSTYSYGDKEAINNGRESYIKADCQKCHKLDNQYDPKKSKVTNYGQLVGWVNSCSKFFKIGWDSFTEDEVSEYLNSTHYKLNK